MWSDAKLRNLPIPAKETTTVLDPISGLSLIHRTTGVRSLTVSTRVNGVLKKVTIG